MRLTAGPGSPDTPRIEQWRLADAGSGIDHLPPTGLAHLGPIDGRGLAEQLDLAGSPSPAPFLWTVGRVSSTSVLVEQFLDDLEAAAVSLFPAWLPEAEGITGTGGSSEAAVRRLALRVGSSTEHHGPYLAELAAHALRPEQHQATGFPAEIRARGAARVFAQSYRRSSMAAILQIPELSAAEEQVLVDGAAFIVRYGRMAVWLAGLAFRSVETVPVVAPDRSWPLAGRDEPEPPPVWFAPLAGRPHPASAIESALEAALARESWAEGRRWNHRYQHHALASPMSLDLVWLDERLVVEIDGPEHRQAHKFGADRERDVLLALDGFTVVRFTNDFVDNDLERVVSQLEQLVQNRRYRPPGGSPTS